LEQADKLLAQYQQSNRELNQTIEDNKMNQILLLAQIAAEGVTSTNAETVVANKVDPRI
jgi:Na+-transporting NADH:ubiquinone oxidoreductase subunit NqrC